MPDNDATHEKSIRAVIVKKQNEVSCKKCPQETLHVYFQNTNNRRTIRPVPYNETIASIYRIHYMSSELLK